MSTPLPQNLIALLASVATGTIPSDAESNAVFDTLTPAHRAGLVASLHKAVEGDTPDIPGGMVLRKALDRLDARTTETKALVASILEGVDAAEEIEVVAETDPGAAIAAADDAVEVAAEAVAVIAETITEETEPAVVEAVATAEELIAEADAAVAEAQTASVARPNITRPTQGKITRKHATVAVRPRAVGLAASMAAPASLPDVGHVFARSVSHASGRSPLVSIDTEYTVERTLKRGDMEGNSDKLDATLGMRALAASGGICDPLIGDQDRKVFGVTDRPVRDGLPGFGTSDVGGIRYAPAFILAGGQLGAVDADVYPWDVSGGNVDGAGVWTYAADADPDSSVKPCWVIDCEEELVARVDAITFCAQVGVFAQRFSGNMWTRALDAGAVAHARAAEQRLLMNIDTASLDVTYTGTPATTVRQVISGVGAAAEHLRNSSRLGSGTLMQAILPDWIRTALRADITSKQLAAGTPPEQVGVTDAQIDGIFAAWKVTVIWTQDLDILPGATAGALGAFPTTKAYIFPYGTHVFLDGGRFDTGVMIDPQLMETNNVKLFFETFEGVLNYHNQSIELAIPIAEGLDCCEVA